MKDAATRPTPAFFAVFWVCSVLDRRQPRVPAPKTASSESGQGNGKKVPVPERRDAKEWYS